MNYEKIKHELPQIIEIVSNVPEQFKEKCFDILLTTLLAEENQKAFPPSNKGSQDNAPQIPPSGNKTPIPAAVRAFMQRLRVTDDELSAVILHENGEIHFVHQPTTKIVSQGQIEWSLLLALKNAVLSGEFSVDPEDVRSICKAKDIYSQDHFAEYFKKKAGLFKGPMLSQGDPQSLTSEGESELAKLIKTLAGATQN